MCIKRLLKLIRGPSISAMEEIIDELLKKGYLELVGYDHGEEVIRTTEKGLKFLEEYKRRRP